MVLIGEMWSKLPEAQKSAYQNRAAKSREKYQKELAEYNASKKAAAKADSAAPAAEAVPSKKRKKSEDGGEKKKVAFRCPSQTITPSDFYRCTFHTEKEEEQEEGCVANRKALRLR